MPQPNSPELRRQLEKEWEAKLAKAGMPSEPKPDKGCQALQEQLDAHEGRSSVDESAIMQELYSYWLTRGEVSFGHHKTIAQGIEERLGLSAGTIDESLIKTAKDEVAAAQSLMRKTLQRLSYGDPSLAYSAQTEKKLRRELESKLTQFSPQNIEELLMRMS